MEWFYYSKSDRSNIGCLIEGGLLIAVAIIASFFLLRPHKTPDVQTENIDDSFIALRIKTEVLKEAFTYNAQELFDVGTFWNFSVRAKNTEQAKSKFNNIFMGRDSAAVKIAKDYPDLFQFKKHYDGTCEFKMKKTTALPEVIEYKRDGNGNIKLDSDGNKIEKSSHLTSYTIVPAYVLANLINEKILILPETERD